MPVGCLIFFNYNPLFWLGCNNWCAFDLNIVSLRSLQIENTIVNDIVNDFRTIRKLADYVTVQSMKERQLLASLTMTLIHYNKNSFDQSFLGLFFVQTC